MALGRGSYRVQVKPLRGLNLPQVLNLREA